MGCDAKRPFRLGVLTGIESEARILRRTLPPHEILPSLIVLSAARPEGAARALAELKRHQCTHLLSWGLAGGLDPSLKPGTLLLPQFVLTPGGNTIPVTEQWYQLAQRTLETLSVSTAPVRGVDLPVISVDEKASLYAQFRATNVSAVDMESHVLAELAQVLGLSFLVIRVIVDSAQMTLPDAARTSVTPAGKTNLPTVLRSLFSNPTQLPELIRLGRAARKATGVLLRCANMGARSGFGMFPLAGDLL